MNIKKIIENIDNYLADYQEYIKQSYIKYIKSVLSDDFQYNRPKITQDQVRIFANDFEAYFTYIYLASRVALYNATAKANKSQFLTFAEKADFLPKEAINALLNQLELSEGTIFKTIFNSETQAEIGRLLTEKMEIMGELTYYDFIEKLNKNMLDNMQEGQTYNEWLKNIRKDGLTDIVMKSGYLFTVFETNSGSFFNAGIVAEAERLKDYIAYMKYITIDGGRAEICKELSGQVKTMQEWQLSGLIPPNHYNCRSSLQAVFKFNNQNIEPSNLDLSKIKLDNENFRGSPVNEFYKSSEDMKERLKDYRSK